MWEQHDIFFITDADTRHFTQHNENLSKFCAIFIRVGRTEKYLVEGR